MNCVVCRSALAVVWCQADKAALCSSCDQCIHQANPIARSHKRTPVCELCKRAPATVRCVEDACVLCSTCDIEVHSANPLPHTRRPLDEAPAPPADGEASATSKPVVGGPVHQCNSDVASLPSSTAVVPEIPSAASAQPSTSAAAPPKDKDADLDLLLDFELGGWLDAGFDISELLGGPISPGRPPAGDSSNADGLVPTFSGDHGSSGLESRHNNPVPPMSNMLVPPPNMMPSQPAHQAADHAVPNFIDTSDFDFVVPSFDLGSSGATNDEPDAFDFLTQGAELGMKRQAGLLIPDADDGMVPSFQHPAKMPRTSTSTAGASATTPGIAASGTGMMPDTLLPPVAKPSPAQLAAAKAADAAANAAYQASAQQALLAGGANLTREQRVARYREKRKRRKFEKTIRYASRKAYAEVRPRIKGRFATREEVAAWKLANGFKEGQEMPATITLD